jgi:hypothetical protein
VQVERVVRHPATQVLSEREREGGERVEKKVFFRQSKLVCAVGGVYIYIYIYIYIYMCVCVLREPSVDLVCVCVLTSEKQNQREKYHRACACVCFYFSIFSYFPSYGPHHHRCRTCLCVQVLFAYCSLLAAFNQCYTSRVPSPASFTERRCSLSLTTLLPRTCCSSVKTVCVCCVVFFFLVLRK